LHADHVAPLIGARVAAVDPVAGDRRPHGNAGVLAQRGPLAPDECRRLALVLQAEQVPAEVDNHTLAGHRDLTAAVVRIVIASRKTAGPLVGLGVLVLLVVLPAPALAAVGIQAVDDAAEVLEVDRVVGPGRRARHGPADIDAFLDLAGGRFENVE